jgi:D-alanyl-D-alanine carboxypeptidase
MKHFFYVVFGGVGAVASGILIAFLGRNLVSAIGPHVANLDSNSVVNVASAVVAKPIEGTSISGLKRKVLYTASEEEDLMTAATLSLPRNFVEGLSSKSYVIKKVKDGSVFAQQDSDRLLPMASLTKLVTAVIAEKVMKGTEKIKITEAVTSAYGNTAGLKVGEIIQAGDLMYPLLMVSSNDAAEALARSYGRRQFIESMNEFVQSIGAYRTSFSDPSGLSPNNKSTANDLVTIMTWIEKNVPEILEITRMKTKTVRAHTWTNPAHFLSWSNYRGGKNGYTDEAHQTGVALFEMDKELYAVAILGSKARDADIVKLLGKVK